MTGDRSLRFDKYPSRRQSQRPRLLPPSACTSSGERGEANGLTAHSARYRMERSDYCCNMRENRIHIRA